MTEIEQSSAPEKKTNKRSHPKSAARSLPFKSEGRPMNKREASLQARRKKQRNNRLMMQDLRVIEKRNINEFQVTAQDRRIESLVENVGKMNASQVEMEFDLEHLKIMARKSSMQDPLPLEFDQTEEDSKPQEETQQNEAARIVFNLNED